METESDYDADEGPDAGSLGLGVKLLIVAGSLGAASIVGVYVHPHLLPLATERAPQLWTELRGWLTAPVLFLLLNMVVGTLYVSSSLMSKAQTDEDAPQPASAMPDVTSTGAAGERAAPAAAPAKATGGLRARLGQSRGFGRLVRSKSEQIPAVSAKAAAGRLKKAGTVETTSPRQKLRPVVVVADPPDDAPAGHEEVDKKADAFISKVYHRMKLQRLESLKRQERQE